MRETAVAGGLAQYLEDRPRARRRLIALKVCELLADALDIALGREDASEWLQSLEGRGVVVGRFGLPASVGNPDVLSTNAPARHLLHAYNRTLATSRYKRVLSGLGQDQRALAQFRSCGGPDCREVPCGKTRLELGPLRRCGVEGCAQVVRSTPSCSEGLPVWTAVEVQP